MGLAIFPEIIICSTGGLDVEYIKYKTFQDQIDFNDRLLTDVIRLTKERNELELKTEKANEIIKRNMGSSLEEVILWDSPTTTSKEIE